MEQISGDMFGGWRGAPEERRSFILPKYHIWIDTDEPRHVWIGNGVESGGIPITFIPDVQGPALIEIGDQRWIQLTEKGQPDGVATLDAGGKVPLDQLPASVQGGIKVIGFWDASTNTPDLSALTLNQGEAYQVTVSGSTDLNGETNWKARDLVVWDDNLAGNYFKIDNTDDVTGSVSPVDNISIAYISSTAGTNWTTRGSVIFPGTDVSIPTALRITALRNSGGNGYDLRVYDLTNAMVIAEISGLTNGAMVIHDLGAISNLSSTEAIWELQSRRGGGGGNNPSITIESFSTIY